MNLASLLPGRLGRLLTIEGVFVKYGLDELLLSNASRRWLVYLFYLSPTRWLNAENRRKPRGERIRLALEELGPVFVKLGQVLSTRRDLLPEDIGDELARLQDDVAPFGASIAREVIEQSLGGPVEQLFAQFESEPLASASIAQVHAARLSTGEDVIVKVLRPGIGKTIDRDVSLMYLIADLFARVWKDANRFKAREVVAEYDITIHDELDLIREASNAVTLKGNFDGSETLYVPTIHWDYVRKNVLVMERVHGIPIRDINAMKAIGMNMKKLAESGVEIFYTQVFEHNFFHADMHPGNIFVSRDNVDNPMYIAIDFGIVGSLTEQDQRYLGENMLAFFRRDYRRVAQLHVDSGWVPADTRVSELENAIRAVCDPIFDKPLAEISFGIVLVRLFETARRFNMEVQPQLVLLQKTLLNIEGLGRELYPDLDLWVTAKPFLERWVLKRRGPAAVARKFVDQLPFIVDTLPELPALVHASLKHQANQAHTAGLQVTNVSGHASVGQQRKPLRLKRLLTGGAVLVCTALAGSAWYIVNQGQETIPVWVWIGGVVGLWWMLTA